jgi:hypothetical protein
LYPNTNTTTLAAARAAFVHVTDVVRDNENDTKALKLDGIRNIDGILRLDDYLVADLQYPDKTTDPNNPTLRHLNKGDSGILKTFIHDIHYHDEINDPIGDKWLSITKK